MLYVKFKIETFFHYITLALYSLTFFSYL